MTGAVLADGTSAVVRRMAAADRSSVAALFGAISEQNLYTRFFTLGSEAVTRHLEHLFADQSTALSYVVEVAGRLVGVADVEAVDPESSEIAFLVADDMHGLGIATLLLERAAHDARNSGVPWFVSDVLAINHPMLQVFTDAGFLLEIDREGTDVAVRMSTTLSDEATAATHLRRLSAEARRLGHDSTSPR
ncbi:GNAT family N-acetyltransferase [Aeromicrobium sp.]|uniref:GNAT family N-acetyltransferase n=1 Tax=Aeromicrobium sp. TaxID=1871063 RepID=UPI00199BE0D2|nr:GNAT family N-acetyltransferase [Aeromicrobium sp.]MBC7631596.1 GNAT family N-acetyltransferase [Aeromicrobium sp.]